MRRPSLVRLTYFEGLQVPRVEIWERQDSECGGMPRYAYTTTGGGPRCETDAEWYAALAAAEIFEFIPMGVDISAESGGASRDEQRVANGSDRKDGVPPPPSGTPEDDGVVDRADEVDSGR